MAEIILREACNNVLGSVTDLCKGFLGRLTRDARLLGGMEGGRQVGKVLLINHCCVQLSQGGVRCPT